MRYPKGIREQDRDAWGMGIGLTREFTGKVKRPQSDFLFGKPVRTVHMRWLGNNQARIGV